VINPLSCSVPFRLLTLGLALAALTLALAACGSSEHAIADGDEVTLNYVGTLDDGSEFDSSLQEGREPFTFTVGAGQVIDGFDEAVRGMKVGEEKTFRVDAEDAYGLPTDERIIDVPVTDLPEDLVKDLEVGLGLYNSLGQQFTVLAFTDATVTLDGNHPLAGQALTFAITIMDVTPAE
jgi:peptidylprolyl isomerase